MEKIPPFEGASTYALRVSRRAKNLRITIGMDGSVVVTVPKRMDVAHAERFVARKSAWITGKLAHFKKLREKFGDGILKKSTPGEYEKYKDAARALAERRIAHFGAIYPFLFSRISIRNQKTRWGSCSRKGNLNFNYKIALLPERLADYIIVHELCHLAEFNHSRKFWDLVARTIPDHAARRRELRIGGMGM